MVYYDTLTIGKTASIGLETNEEAKAPLHISGGNDDLVNSEGDLKIGDDNCRLKIGVARSGENAGDVHIRADGGTNRLMLGGGSNDTLAIVDGNVGIGTTTPSEKLEVKGTVSSTAFVGNGSAINDLDAANITTGIVNESLIPLTVARESRFDPANGHKHTGAAGDGPKLSHSNLDNILTVNTSSSDLTSNKHVSDALAKSWQDHVMIKSGNPHGTTATDVGALPNAGGTINGSLQVNGNIGTTGTVDGVDISSFFNNFTGHKHTGAAGDGSKVSHGNLSDILQVNPASNDSTSTKHVSDALAKGWQDHIKTTSGNPHGTTATSVGALPISGGTINGTLQVNGNIGVYGNIGIGTTNPDKNNKLQVEGNLHMNGNSIFLRVNPADQFDVIKWNSNSDRVDIGGFNGVNLCRTRGGASPVLAPALSVDANGNVGIGTTNPDQNNKLQVEGNLHMNGNSIFLRRGPSDQFDVIRWNSSSDRVDIGGFNGVNLCYTNGASNPITLKPALSVDANGNVGIGKDPLQKLDIQGDIRIGGSRTHLDGYTTEGDGYSRTLTHRVMVNGTEAIYFKRFYEGGHSLGNSISIPDNWSFNAKYKNFLINHPLRPDTHDLIHSTLEGPEVAVFYRGESQLSNGEIVVLLPDYFEALTRRENRTVLLTPKLEENIEVVSMLGASDVKDGKFTVKMIDGKNPSQKFYWEVKAVRADVEILQVEQAKVPVK